MRSIDEHREFLFLLVGANARNRTFVENNGIRIGCKPSEQLVCIFRLRVERFAQLFAVAFLQRFGRNHLAEHAIHLGRQFVAIVMSYKLLPQGLKTACAHGVEEALLVYVSEIQQREHHFGRGFGSYCIKIIVFAKEKRCHPFNCTLIDMQQGTIFAAAIVVHLDGSNHISGTDGLREASVEGDIDFIPKNCSIVLWHREPHNLVDKDIIDFSKGQFVGCLHRKEDIVHEWVFLRIVVVHTEEVDEQLAQFLRLVSGDQLIHF